jgi:exodeoxyribonuclease VIII
MNIMLDLETMGNRPDAAIVSIGAVEFDLTNKVLGRKFYKRVSLEDSIRAGGQVDGSTVLWWMQQSVEARLELTGESVAEPVALVQFAQFVAESDGEVLMWGNGAAFDNVILAQAYRRNCLDVPWSFWEDRCYRTLKNLKPEIECSRVGTHHNALDDAVSQALHALVLLSVL